MKCPVCVEETLVISSREGVEIDHCPQCRGVWLDRGELDKIIDRASPSAPARDDRDRDREDRDRDRDRYDERDRDRYDDRNYGKKRKKRGGFLEDLFDFD